MKAKHTFSSNLTQTALCSAVFALSLTACASAATGTWTSTTGGNWEDATTAPWSSGVVAGAATFAANFTSDIAADSTVTLTANRTIGNLTFNDAGATVDSRWTLASSGGSVLTLDNGGSQSLITKTSATTISSQLSGSNIKITGGGALTLSGNNTGITGNVDLNGNNGVVISNANALGSALITFSGNEAFSGSASGITIANNIAFSGGVSWYSGTNALKTTGSVTLSGANQGFQNFSSGSITEWAGNTVLGANTLNMGGGGSGGLRLSGVVSGTGGKISKLVGLSTLYLTGTAANTFTGGITFNLGTIRVGNNDAALGTGTLAVGATNANASVTNVLATDNGGGARNLANAITITNNGTGTTTLQLDGGWANLQLSGNISGNGGISTTSSGKVLLTGTNTYTGSTVLSGSNTLVLSGSNTTSGISVGSGTTLALRSISLSSTQNITGAGNVTKDIAVFGDSTIAGTNNNYTGSTVVNLSKFNVASGGVINGTSSISVLGQFGAQFINLGSVTTPGALTVNGSSNAADGIFNNGNGTAAGSFNAASITLQSSFLSDSVTAAHGGEFNNKASSTVNLGSGAITVNGQGNTLAGGSTASGSTFSNAGTVTAGSITLNSSSTANTVSNKGGTYTQTGGSTSLSGTVTLAANGGTGAAGTAGNDAAFNLSGGTFSANTLAVNSGTVSATGGTLNIGSGGITKTGTAPTQVNLGATTVGATAAWSSSVDLTLTDSTTGTTFNTTGGNISLSGALSGAGSKLVKSGTGSLTLSGTSTYTGTTTVSAGTMLVNGTLGDTAVSVSNGATLGGTGIITGSVAFSGNSTLNIVDVNDGLDIAGSVTFGSGFGFDNITGWDYQNAALGTYTLLKGSNISLTDMDNVGLENALTLTNGNKVFFQQGSLQAVVTVPETSTALLGGIGLLLLLRRRR